MRVRVTLVVEYDAEPEDYEVNPGEELTIERVKEIDGCNAIFEWLEFGDVDEITFEEIK